MVCYSPISIRAPDSKRNNNRLSVPCGKCYACRMNLRMSWTYRIWNELQYSYSAYFITLTYNNENLPQYGTLVKNHLQQYIKNLRYYHDKKSKLQMRFYGVGEYGENFARPHYHILLFNYFGDLNYITDVWKNGFVHIGNVSQASIHYCTKDIQKQVGKKKVFCIDEFRLMTTKPSIGYQKINYLLNKKKDNNFFIKFGSINMVIPRYYKTKIFSYAQMSIHANEMVEYADKQYNERIKELYAKGVDNPFVYIEKERESLVQIENKKLKNRKL